MLLRPPSLPMSPPFGPGPTPSADLPRSSDIYLGQPSILCDGCLEVPHPVLHCCDVTALGVSLSAWPLWALEPPLTASLSAFKACGGAASSRKPYLSAQSKSSPTVPQGLSPPSLCVPLSPLLCPHSYGQGGQPGTEGLTASSSWFRARKRSLWLEMMESSESTWPSGRALLAGAEGPVRWREGGGVVAGTGTSCPLLGVGQVCLPWCPS